MAFINNDFENFECLKIKLKPKKIKNYERRLYKQEERQFRNLIRDYTSSPYRNYAMVEKPKKLIPTPTVALYSLIKCFLQKN